ncbi:ATP-grasp domain-containing protein [Ancylomarina euxinus]|uniref:ATP-grasp domain-containing protein n=1 Tax=Ancylomarina euxinus TaxID=2283627 RepID=A0A425Y2G8_9BACT|nr:ATP-grasp domain-containing protein [Ancylomarina euxinus]MCZ4694952.1 ATP-grasp domain-containing protein [Ancylomarina euxinus]MUP14818.1 ATP-grasp domain-containing protein [Ancylomarina euxinus]RRG22162.1 ATP-grasp domain-containing protein [Ancylomarina euxinus]
MILLDKPYVSQFLKDTITKYNFSALDTGNIIEDGEIALIKPEAIIQQFEHEPNSRLYTNSENSINWVSTHLAFTKLPEYIKLFKNKIEFRKLIKSIYPNFFFKEVSLQDLDHINLEDLPMPFIIKPTVGFLSLGVHKVVNKEEWLKVKQDIHKEFSNAKSLFPIEVINASSFIIEEVIAGNEFAFDAYFDEKGEAVVLGITQHLFASEKDVSDRVYFTSKELIQTYLPQFTLFVKSLGKQADIKNFPVHIEVRVDHKGKLIPIEVNPMRFGGWCTTADLTHLAMSLNPYHCFLKNIKPDWEQILNDMDDEIYSLIILDNSTGISSGNIAQFDYEKLLKQFSNPLELRKIDYKTYPIFGMLYTKSEKSKFREIEEILVSNLREFVTEK